MHMILITSRCSKSLTSHSKTPAPYIKKSTTSQSAWAPGKLKHSYFLIHLRRYSLYCGTCVHCFSETTDWSNIIHPTDFVLRLSSLLMRSPYGVHTPTSLPKEKRNTIRSLLVQAKILNLINKPQDTVILAPSDIIGTSRRRHEGQSCFNSCILVNLKLPRSRFFHPNPGASGLIAPTAEPILTVHFFELEAWSCASILAHVYVNASHLRDWPCLSPMSSLAVLPSALPSSLLVCSLVQICFCS